MQNILVALAIDIIAITIEVKAMKKFKQSDPPTFQHASPPEEVDEWIKKLEKAFEIAKCLEANKI